MKLLMLCPSLSGSSFALVKNYISWLPRDWDITAVGPTFGDKLFLHEDGFKIERVEPPIKRPVQIGMISLIPRNVRRLKRMDYDIVHAFKLLPNTAPAAAKAKRKTGKPLVLTIDDYELASAKGLLKKTVLRWCQKYAKEADAVTVASRTLQRLYGGELLYQTANARDFDPRRHTGARVRKKFGVEDKIMIGHAGTIFPHKGIDVLIRAVQSLGDDRLRIVLVKMGADAERCVRMSGPETVWGQRESVPNEDVPEYTAACDIYVIPTRDTPFARAQTPQKLFEAMAMGRPIVASRIADIPEILGDAGILVEPGDVNELANAIQALADDEALRKKLGKRARERYLKHYSSDVIGKQLVSVYRKVLDSGS